MRAGLGLLLLPALAGCGSPDPMQFPVGFFGVETAEDLRMLAGRGYNAFQSYRTTPDEIAPVAREARRQSAMLLVSPNALLVTTHTASEFPGVVWYLQDEPDVHGMDQAAMKAVEIKVRAWAPGWPTAFVVGDGSKAKNYPDVADAIMVDWYPVPHLPLESAGDHVRMTAEAAGKRKVWAVLQAMDWREFQQRDPKKERIGRFPDMAEIRFMSYDAVLNGAQGVWYFTYSLSGGRMLAQKPELMFAVDSVAKELRAMAPIFARGRPIPLPFSTDTRLRARAWTYHGRDYVMLINRTQDRGLQVPAAMLEPTWRPLFEARRDPRELLHAAHGAYYLMPYKVLVLESRLRPGRIVGL